MYVRRVPRVLRPLSGRGTGSRMTAASYHPLEATKTELSVETEAYCCHARAHKFVCRLASAKMSTEAEDILAWATSDLTLVLHEHGS